MRTATVGDETRIRILGELRRTVWGRDVDHVLWAAWTFLLQVVRWKLKCLKSDLLRHE